MAETVAKDAPNAPDPGEQGHEIARVRRRLRAVQEIGRALGTTLNLDRLLTLIMDKVTELMCAERSTLFIVDRNRREIWSKIAQGLSEELTTIRIPLGQGLAGWTAQTGRTLNIKDAHRDPRFDASTDAATGYRTRSVLCHPLVGAKGRTIGVIQVLNRENGYFTIEDEEMLAALSAQAAISLQNAELYRTVQRRNIELVEAQRKLERQLADRDALLAIEEAVSSQHTLSTLFDAILEGAMTSLPSEAGAILVRDAQTNQLVFRSARGSGAERTSEVTLEPDEGISSWVARTGQSVLSNDVEEDPRYAREAAASLGIQVRTMICVPVTLDQEVIGAIQLLNRRGRIPQYGEADLKLLTLIAGQTARAIQAQRARDAFIDENRLAAIGQSMSAVIHDFKTPMTIISGYTQLLAGEEDSEHRAEYTDSIQNQITHLNTMMREVLAFARGERNLFIRKVFIDGFFDEVVETLRKEFEGRGVTLVLDVEYRQEIHLDAAKMRRVLFNLAHNAADAMPDGGTFTIRVSAEEDQVLFSFTDTGLGIPEDIQAHVFDAFVTHGKRDGTGLGLAIVKKTVEQHEGTIAFTTAPGEGSTFTVSLPRGGPQTPSA